MIIKITLSSDKGTFIRTMDWEIDGDHLDKGETIEEMMAIMLDDTPAPF